jgi:hypothetical protein
VDLKPISEVFNPEPSLFAVPEETFEQDGREYAIFAYVPQRRCKTIARRPMTSGICN